MYPPTISLASTYGPSMAPDAVRTLPFGLSLAPMSKMFALSFSFQALQTAYISCIFAGEDGCSSIGLRCRSRYFWVGIVSPFDCRRDRSPAPQDAPGPPRWTPRAKKDGHTMRHPSIAA